MFKDFVNSSELFRGVVFVALVLVLVTLQKYELLGLTQVLLGVLGSGLLCFYPTVLASLSKELVGLKMFSLAMSVCEHGLRLIPDDAILLANRSVVHLRCGRYREGLADADQAIKHKSDLWQAWCNRGAAAFCLKQYSAAESDCSRAIELAAEADSAYVVRAWARYLQYNPLGCLEDCKNLAQTYQYQNESRLLTVLASLMNNDIERAEKALKELAGARKTGARETIAFVDFESTRSNYVEVLRLCADASVNGFGQLSFLIFQAHAYHCLQEGALAWRSALQAEALDSTSTAALEIKAIILADAGLVDEALLECQSVVLRDLPVTMKNAEAIVRECRGEFEEMVQATEFGLNRNPLSAGTHALHALALAHLGRPDEASAAAAAALRMNAQCESVQSSVGKAFLKSNKLPRALEHLNNAIAINSHCKCAYESRAEVYRLMGKFSEAESDLFRVEQLQAQYMLGLPALLQDYCDQLGVIPTRLPGEKRISEANSG